MDNNSQNSSPHRPALEAELHRDIACTICGCVCDDLTVGVRGNRVVQLERACALAEPWYWSLNEIDEAAQPAARVRGAAVTWESAAGAAAELLRAARAPLVFGLSRSSTDGQRAAVRLADRLGAYIDTTASRCHAPSIMALQQVGESTCSLGEVRNRSDLVIYWGSNPMESHPRHWERYAVDPSGMFVPGGRRDRYVVVIDTQPTSTSREADLFVQVEPQRDFEMLWALRTLVAQQELHLPAGATPSQAWGCSLESLQALATRLTTCRSGIVFFGLGLTRYQTGHASVEALLRLVTDLNRYTRFYARRMRVPGDVAGADSVLCWQTGFPFSVNLARGYPRYNPDEYSANELLARGEVDACLIVGSESVRRLSAPALAQLDTLPTITLDYPTERQRLRSDIEFTTSIYGVHAAGTAYRMDEVPIPLRPFLSSALPTDGTVLREITRLV